MRAATASGDISTVFVRRIFIHELHTEVFQIEQVLIATGSAFHQGESGDGHDGNDATFPRDQYARAPHVLEPRIHEHEVECQERLAASRPRRRANDRARE